MVDLEENDRGNISLPPRLQSPDLIDPDYVYDKKTAEPIMNMQTAWYEILISDEEKNIQRLETRNNELSNVHGDTETLMNSRDVETGDEIAYLNKLMSIESEKVDDIREKIDDIARLRDMERQAHLRNVDSSNEKYENTRVALTSSIKALNSRINTLEDYKQSRVALLEKLRIRDETLARNEDEIAQKQDAIDRKFKIDREKLKNEMYSRLLALAGTFQLEISDTIALPVHRLMRENIFIKAHLSQIVDETLKCKEDYARMRTMENVHRHSIKSDIEATKKNLITTKIQECLLKGLKKMHSSMKKRLSWLDRPQEFSQEIYDYLTDTVKAELAKYETRTRKLEVMLHRESIELGRAKYIKNQIDFRAKIYEEILYDVKYTVACALKMTETGQDILEMSESELFSLLLDLFVRGQSKIRQSLAAASNESVPRPDYVYIKGDLGFVPEYIDLEKLKIREELALERETETINLAITAISDVFSHAISPQHDVLEEGARTDLTEESSAEESSETSVKTASIKTEESSDHQKDISESADSVIRENEESLSAESKEHEEA